MPTRSLPRSLSPLPDESIPGYLLRLAYRLDRTPGRIAILAGLSESVMASRGSGQLPANVMLNLTTAESSSFATAARLTHQEVAALCLNQYADRYPFVDTSRGSRPRYRGDARRTRDNPWVFTNSTRYCPECLSGDRSLIQRQLGGAWRQQWRLPPVVVCLMHRRLLEHLCPDCGTPPHYRKRSGLLPRPGLGGLHPAQCRSEAYVEYWQRRRLPSACGGRLDVVSRSASTVLKSAAGDPLLEFQHRVRMALSTQVMDQRPTHDYFLDLFGLAILIQLSWPLASDLAGPPELSDALDQHVEDMRREMIRLRRERDQVTAGFSLLKAMPLDTRACSSLLLVADQILGNRERIKDRVEPLLKEALSRERALTYILRAKGPYAELLGGALIRQRNGFRRANRVRSRIQRYAAVDCSFTPDHIPQMPRMAWFGNHLGALDGINLKLLRRAAAVRLVEHCSGGSWIEASEAFGMPRTTTHSTLQTVKRWTANPANRLKFQQVVRALSLHLEGEDALVNYGNRRRQLRDWVISPKEWDELTADLCLPKNNLRHGWPDTVRKAATVLVWARLTLSEYLFAPLYIAEKQAYGGTNPVTRTVHGLRGHRASRIHPYATFRDRIDTYADRLADDLDNT
jgi:hypothetical protein